MKKNDTFYGTCIDYTYDGLGIVKYEGFPYFVKNMIKGESGKIVVIKMLKKYGVGRLLENDTPSSYRTEPLCPVYKACGGCHLQHLSTTGQQVFKTERVKDCLTKIGHCDVEVQDCLMMEDPWYYRNKAQVPVGNKDGHLIAGFYKQHTNDIISSDTCYIHTKLHNEFLQYIIPELEKYHNKGFDKVNHTGNIKHILTKVGYHTGEMMVVFITYNRKIKGMHMILEDMLKKFPQIKTVIQNINPRHDNVILGDEEIVLYGDGTITDTLLNNTFKISLKSFYQINPLQVEVLYSTAIEMAELKDTDTVLDAYCGIGTIGLSFAKKVKHVTGVEIVEAAIEDAKKNAKRNHINNIDFLCKDAGEFMKKHTQDGYNVVFVDPPRKGCSKDFLEALVTLSPEKLVYISCDVSTQARDIDYLQSQGYKAIKCQPVDMFPSTYHVENIVLMLKQDL